MYDETILSHYAEVAQKEGHLTSCTMADQRIRDLESKFILDAIRAAKKEISGRSPFDKQINLLDVGCGNGFTLSLIRDRHPELKLSGIEFTPELRVLANDQGLTCKVFPGDVRDKSTIPQNQNIIISQRVIINLLSIEDQKIALNNLIDSLAAGGFLVIVEAFESGLANLNKCRNELGLSPIPPAHHNLYLSDDFFIGNPQLTEVSTDHGPNILSTHYFVSRVLHDVALAATKSGFTRNSLFVRFFDQALPLGIGEFAPLKCLVYRKKETQ